MFWNRFNYGFIWLLLMFFILLMPTRSMFIGLIAGIPLLTAAEYLGADLQPLFNGDALPGLSLLLVICGALVFLMSYLMDKSKRRRGFTILLAVGVVAGALTLTASACDYKRWRQLPEVGQSEDHFNVIYTRADYYKKFLIPAAFAGGAAGLYAAALLGGTTAAGMMILKRRTAKTMEAAEPEPAAGEKLS